MPSNGALTPGLIYATCLFSYSLLWKRSLCTEMDCPGEILGVFVILLVGFVWLLIHSGMYFMLGRANSKTCDHSYHISQHSNKLFIPNTIPRMSHIATIFSQLSLTSIFKELFASVFRVRWFYRFCPGRNHSPLIYPKAIIVCGELI